MAFALTDLSESELGWLVKIGQARRSRIKKGGGRYAPDPPLPAGLSEACSALLEAIAAGDADAELAAHLVLLGFLAKPI